MIKLNCDLGESFGIWQNRDEYKIMSYIDMANLACGFHAGDPLTMTKAIIEAKKNSLVIGAHPGYQDILGFGRRSIEYQPDELKATILYQIGALRAIANSLQYDISYIKPHGALYNDMMRDEAIFKTILKTLSSYDRELKLMILSSSKNELFGSLADDYGIELIYEVFADRAYDANGFLVSRKKRDSLLQDVNLIKERVNILVKEGYIKSIDGKKLYIKADTICVHGDSKKALEITKAIRESLSS